MRSITGWIRNLADGLGPSAGTVPVFAHPTDPEHPFPNNDLDLTTHRLGAVTYVHLSGSGSQTRANGEGHFGWEMELSPGPINVEINPEDPPPTQYRRRFPDESAQIGKGFISDIERLGWAGGKDHLIWNAVFGGDNPNAAQWNPDPTVSWGRGNGSLDLGSTPGRVTIRRFIAMLGGVPFTVEMGDLVIPITGEDAQPTNPAGSDRWDLICARIDWNPGSPTYGKQSFEFTTGVAGAGIPSMTPNGTDNYRRMPLHAVKMAAGQGVYSGGMDLRPWAPGSQPDGLGPGPITTCPIAITAQPLNVGDQASTLNTTLASNPVILNPSCAWDGTVTLRYRAVVVPTVAGASLYSRIDTTAIGVTGTETSVDLALSCLNEGNQLYPRTIDPLGLTTAQIGITTAVPITVTYPLRRVPAFASSASRTWSTLRFGVRHFRSGGLITLVDQSLAIHLWPVT